MKSEEKEIIKINRIPFTQEALAVLENWIVGEMITGEIEFLTDILSLLMTEWDNLAAYRGNEEIQKLVRSLHFLIINMRSFAELIDIKSEDSKL
jgi:hypothetical protein